LHANFFLPQAPETPEPIYNPYSFPRLLRLQNIYNPNSSPGTNL
jgi:hypothetical protein